MMAPCETERFFYATEAGEPRGCVGRTDETPNAKKRFVQDRWESGEYVAGLKGAKLPLYRLAELRSRIERGQTVFVTEGERKANTLAEGLRKAKFGAAVTTIAGGCREKMTDEHIAQLHGVKRVVVLADSDESGREAARLRAKTILRAYPETDVRVVDFYPDRIDGSDVADFLDEGAAFVEFREIVARAPRVALEPVAIALPHGLDPDAPEPAHTPELAALLDQVGSFIRKYVVLSEPQITTLALWVAHTHAFAAAQTTAYIAIMSVEMRSGKTRLLETLEFIVPRPWMTARATAAALIRKVDKDTPTLLFDELDATFKSDKEKAEATRQILNSGYNSEGRASVCVGQGANIETRDLRTFCAKALAGIGKLPDTIRDRSIVIELRRKIAGEEAARFRRRYVKPQAAPIRGALVAWAPSSIARLAESDPAIPEGISDRAADCWEPLLAIADLAGGDWPTRGRDAANVLSGPESVALEDLTYGVRLLSDIRDVFDDAKEDRLTSARLTDELSKMEESPWGPEHGKPFDARALALKLRPYRIRPKQTRFGQESLKGYQREHFEDAWKRYVPGKSAFDRNNRNNPMATGFPDTFQTETEPHCFGQGSIEKLFDINDVSIVSAKTQYREAGGAFDDEMSALDREFNAYFDISEVNVWP